MSARVGLVARAPQRCAMPPPTSSVKVPVLARSPLDVGGLHSASPVCCLILERSCEDSFFLNKNTAPAAGRIIPGGWKHSLGHSALLVDRQEGCRRHIFYQKFELYSKGSFDILTSLHVSSCTRCGYSIRQLLLVQGMSLVSDFWVGFRCTGASRESFFFYLERIEEVIHCRAASRRR